MNDPRLQRARKKYDPFYGRPEDDDTREPMGVMWEWDRERPLFVPEYLFWMNHPLPFGWAILVAPDKMGRA